MFHVPGSWFLVPGSWFLVPGSWFYRPPVKTCFARVRSRVDPIDGIAQFKTAEKIISHHSRFVINYDIPLWRGPALKKKPPFSNARGLTRVKLCVAQYWGLTLNHKKTASKKLAL